MKYRRWAAHAKRDSLGFKQKFTFLTIRFLNGSWCPITLSQKGRSLLKLNNPIITLAFR
jgi:hypothetical protein